MGRAASGSPLRTRGGKGAAAFGRSPPMSLEPIYSKSSKKPFKMLLNPNTGMKFHKETHFI